MKLVRFGDPGQEKPGVLADNGDILDVSACASDFNSDFLSDDGIEKLRSWLESNQATAPVAASGVRLGPPVADPSKIICVGLNYSDHAAESGMEVPPEPVIFTKAVTALSGPNDPIQLPRNSEKTDWEVEIAFVVGKRSKYVEKSEALSHIAGYAIMNDVSEREFQAERCGQWVKGKSHDTFAPFGPFLATTDEIPDPQNLAMHLDVSGERMQTGSTQSMVYDIITLLSYISQFMTFLPGDIISTGTPPGVGFGKKPPRYLKAGDIVELEIEGLGKQRQEVIAPE